MADVISYQNIQLNAIYKTWFFENMLWGVSRDVQFYLHGTFCKFLRNKDKDTLWNLSQSGVLLIAYQHILDLPLVTIKGLKPMTLRQKHPLQLVSNFCCISIEILTWYPKTTFKMWYILTSCNRILKRLHRFNTPCCLLVTRSPKPVTLDPEPLYNMFHFDYLVQKIGLNWNGA